MLNYTRMLTFIAFLFPLQSLAEVFYVGFGIGPETTSFNQKAIISRPGTFFTLDKTHYNARGVFGSLFAGYEMELSDCNCEFENINLAAEINASIGTTVFKSANLEFIAGNFNHTKYKVNRHFAISVLPGLHLTECAILYTRLGYARAHFKIKTTDNSLANISRNLNGFKYGLGIKQMLGEAVALRLEYSGIYYRRVNFTVFEPIGGVTKSTSIRPDARTFEIGLLYFF